MNLKDISLGIEFGSTRIKSVAIDVKGSILAQGEFVWENQFIDGVWSYSLDIATHGLQACFKELKDNFFRKYNQKLTTAGSIAISGMMHGYLVFDKNDKQISIFKTWRNTITEKAASILTKEFNFNIPQRWSIAHIYQCMLDNKSEVHDIAFATSLAGYFHFVLTGEKVIGVGDASGLFPIDSATLNYDEIMAGKFQKLNPCKWNILDILPKPLVAGTTAGYLTREGSLILDPTGEFNEGVLFAPPEGDMQTGMAATNSCRAGTGNASLGTSSNTTILTDKEINIHPEIDQIVSPTGYKALLIHVNNCTTDINQWANLFKEVISLGHGNISNGELYTKLFELALKADPKCGGLISYNYYSGEGISKIYEGRPLIVRKPDSKLSLANFMLMQLYSSLATIRTGIDLLKEEGVEINAIYGHGGFFKTPIVGQNILSRIIDAPIIVTKSAGEGGPYGAALLANYLMHKENSETLEDYLDKKIYANVESTSISCSKQEKEDFDKFYEEYKAGLDIERTAVNIIKE